MKKRISWNNAAQLIEYATSQELHKIDEETNQRIINLLKANTNKRKDLITVLRKRMLYNQTNNVISLSIHLINKIIIECSDCVTFFSTVDWQQVFLSLLLNKTASSNRIQSVSSSLNITTKIQLLHLVSNLHQSFPNDIFFQETYNMIRLLGIQFPQVEKTFTESIKEYEQHSQQQFIEESHSIKVTKEQLMKECDEIIGICNDVDETFNYMTLNELKLIKDNVEINEKIVQLEQAQHIITLLLRRKSLSPDLIELLQSTLQTIMIILDKHSKLSNKWFYYISSSSHPIIENTEFYYHSQQK